MTKQFSYGLGLTLLALWAAPASAQPIPGGIPAAPTVAQTAATTAPTAAPFNIFDMFDCTKMKQNCKDCICATPIGQMLNGMTGMAGKFTGGLIPPLCPPPTAAQLAAAALDPTKSDAEKLADAIKADEAQAKARAAAMRFLGTVDCERFKEAGMNVPGELIKGLNDTNECVRLAAAEALGSGCCCNEDTIEALAAVAAGAALYKKNDEGKRDPAAGFQIMPEKCVRVRAAARFALEHCLCCYVKKEPLRRKVGGGEREGDKKPISTGLQQVRFDDQQKEGQKEGLGMPKEKTIQQAEQVLQGFATIETPCGPSRDCSLFGLCSRAMNKHHNKNIIRTTILDTTKDCDGKLVPVGADANAVVRPQSLLKDNMRNMCSPVEHQPVQPRQGGAVQGGPSMGGQPQQSSMVQPGVIYEVTSGTPIPVAVQPVAPRPVMQTTVTAQPVVISKPLPQKTTSFLPIFSKPAPQATITVQPTVVKTEPQMRTTALPVSDRKVTQATVTIPTAAQPTIIVQPTVDPLPVRERRVTSYQLLPPQ